MSQRSRKLGKFFSKGTVQILRSLNFMDRMSGLEKWSHSLRSSKSCNLVSHHSKPFTGPPAWRATSKEHTRCFRPFPLRSLLYCQATPKFAGITRSVCVYEGASDTQPICKSRVSWVHLCTQRGIICLIFYRTWQAIYKNSFNERVNGLTKLSRVTRFRKVNSERATNSGNLQ